MFNHRLAAVVDSVCSMATALCGTLSPSRVDNKRDGPRDMVDVMDVSTKQLRSWRQKEGPKVFHVDDHPDSLSSQHASHQRKKETADNTPQSVIIANPKVGTGSPSATPSTSGGSKDNERQSSHDASLEKHEPTDAELPSSGRKEHHRLKEAFPYSTEEESAIVQDSQPDNWMAVGAVERSAEEDESIDIVQGSTEDGRQGLQHFKGWLLEKKIGSSSQGSGKELAAAGLGNGPEDTKLVKKDTDRCFLYPEEETRGKGSFLGQAALPAELALLRQALALCDTMPTSSMKTGDEDDKYCPPNESLDETSNVSLQQGSAAISARPPAAVEPMLSSFSGSREGVATTSTGASSRQPRTISELLLSQKLTQGIPHQTGCHVSIVAGSSAVRRRIALSTAGPRSCLQHLLQDLGDAEEAPEVTRYKRWLAN